MPDLFKDTAPLSTNNTMPSVPATVPPVSDKKPDTSTEPLKTFDSKAGAKRLMDMFTGPADENTGAPLKKDEPKPEVKKDEPKPADVKPIKVKKKDEPKPEIRPPVPKAADLKKEVVPKMETVAPASVIEDEDAFEKDLHDEEKALLEDARAAEKYLGEKYKGHGAKMEKFLKESAAKEKEIGDDFTEEDYKKWYNESRPKIGALDLRQVERARVKEDVTKEFEPKLAEERHARWVEIETPKIEELGKEIRGKIWEIAIPDEVMNVANERTKGVTDPVEKNKILAEIGREYAHEMSIAANITDAVKDDIQEFHRITTINPATGKGLKPLHPDAEVWDPMAGETLPDGRKEGEWVPNLNASNPEARKHAGIMAMVNYVCESFKETGGAALKKDGKWFVTRKEWAKMAPEQRAPYWTFENKEIVQRAQANVKNVVNSAIKAQRDHLESLGYRRQTTSPTAATSIPVAPISGAPPAPRIAPPPANLNSQMTPAQSQAKALAKQLESASAEG